MCYMLLAPQHLRTGCPVWPHLILELLPCCTSPPPGCPPPQAPNAPLESSKVALRPALQLVKFAAAANSFLPVSDSNGTGGLTILPAVLPAANKASAAEPAAVDYRFAINRARQSGYDYFFRLQRCTQELPGGRCGVWETGVQRCKAIAARGLHTHPSGYTHTTPLPHQ